MARDFLADFERGGGVLNRRITDADCNALIEKAEVSPAEPPRNVPVDRKRGSAVRLEAPRSRSPPLFFYK